MAAGSEAPAPLSESEVELVQRLFSDPFSIPLEFKAWLVSYLEGNPPLLTTSAIFGFKASVVSQIASSTAPTPAGAIMQYYGTTDPADSPKWKLMDNRLLDRTVYAKTFAAIGFSGSYPTPGVDPGSNQFYLPEGRGAVLVGKGTHADVNAIGKNDGNVVASRRPKHSHGVGTMVFVGTAGTTGTVSADHTHSGSTNNAGGHAHGGFQAVSPTGGTGGTGYTGGDRANVTITDAIGDHAHGFTTGGISTNHTHAFTPAGTLAGSVGTTSAAPAESEAYLVVNHIMYCP